MFNRLFENRDRRISKLMYLGDNLGYSIREATSVFSIDSINNTVTYITPSNKVISGTYSIDENITLSDIEVYDGEAELKIEYLGAVEKKQAAHILNRTDLNIYLNNMKSDREN